MPRSLGQELKPHVTNNKVGCGKPGCADVTHHDHMYDYVHRLFLDRLSPRIPENHGQRENFGRAFGAFVREHGAAVLKELEDLGFDDETAILRFRTTTVCSCYNAVDGNGKTHPAHAPIAPLDRAYWSMTPKELGDVRKGTATWIETFGDEKCRTARRKNAETFVDVTIQKLRLTQG